MVILARDQTFRLCWLIFWFLVWCYGLFVLNPFCVTLRYLLFIPLCNLYLCGVLSFQFFLLNKIIWLYYIHKANKSFLLLCLNFFLHLWNILPFLLLLFFVFLATLLFLVPYFLHAYTCDSFTIPLPFLPSLPPFVSYFFLLFSYSLFLPFLLA